MISGKDITKILTEKKSVLKEKYFVTEIGLFGSYRNNTQTKTSDVDLLVKFEPGHKDLFNYMRLKFYLEDLLEREVDLVSKDGLKPMLKSRILNNVSYV